VFPSPLDGFSQREHIVVHRIAKIESIPKQEAEAPDVQKGRDATAKLPFGDQPEAKT
jgi:hypothetical protein